MIKTKSMSPWPKSPFHLLIKSRAFELHVRFGRSIWNTTSHLLKWLQPPLKWYGYVWLQLSFNCHAEGGKLMEQKPNAPCMGWGFTTWIQLRHIYASAQLLGVPLGCGVLAKGNPSTVGIEKSVGPRFIVKQNHYHMLKQTSFGWVQKGIASTAKSSAEWCDPDPCCLMIMKLWGWYNIYYIYNPSSRIMHGLESGSQSSRIQYAWFHGNPCRDVPGLSNWSATDLGSPWCPREHPMPDFHCEGFTV